MLSAYDQAVANMATRGFVPGARIMVNGDWPATILRVTDRGVGYQLDAEADGRTSFGYLTRGTYGWDRTTVLENGSPC